MPLDYDILNNLGTNEARFREVFTSSAGTPEFEIRRRWEKRIESAVDMGVQQNLADYPRIGAMDLAWDADTITKMTVPLKLFAQGRIKIEALDKQLKDISPETRAKFIREDEKTKAKTVDIPEFYKVMFNLVRMVVTRRVAQITANRLSLTPFLRFEPVGTSSVAKCRADVLTQRIDRMSNQYSYRHAFVQSARDMLMYTDAVEFVAGAYDVQRQLRRKRVKNGAEAADEAESYITKEGVRFVRPHPTRRYWDTSFPLAALNNDEGPRWCGYWNLVKYEEVRRNTAFFNREKLIFSTDLPSKLTGNKTFLDHYFASHSVAFPEVNNFAGGVDLPGYNDREKQYGVYSTTDEHRSVVLIEHFHKLIPIDEGFGKYPHPVWVRFVVAGSTVVFAEVLPESPACVYSYNANDNRVVNNSFAGDALQFQDHLSNILTHMLYYQKYSLIKFVLADIEQLGEDATLALRKVFDGDGQWVRPVLVEHRGSVRDSMGVKPDAALKVVETDMTQTITTFMQSAMQTLALAERCLGMSSNEAGQSEPREISATESANIATTVNVATNFMQLGLDEGLEAKKRICYGALVSKGSKEIEVPVVNRYLDKTVQEAGFRFVDEDTNSTSDEPRSGTLLGTTEVLEYSTMFTARDGADRAVSSKAAEVIVNLLAQVTNIPGLVEDLGKEKLYEIINEVFRLSGAGVDLKIQLQDGENPQLSGSTKQDREQIQQVVEQLIGAIEQDRAKIAQLEQTVQQILGTPSTQPIQA